MYDQDIDQTEALWSIRKRSSLLDKIPALF